MGLLAGPAQAEDFVIDQPTDQQNGGHPIDNDDTLTVKKTGTINVTGGFAGVKADDGNTITIDGSIATAFGYGIDIFGENTITVNGSINAGEDGIHALGNLNTITNSGSIQARRFGIFVSGSDNDITNSGNINAGSAGINVVGNANDIITSGNITTEDSGILAEGNLNIITNSGRIDATRNGISAFGLFNTITNSGSINAGSIGINVIGSANDIITSGNITAEEIGIRTGGGNLNAITISGRVVARDALSLNGERNTLNLLAPSFVGGGIFLGADTTVNITTGASHSVLWDFSSGTMEGDAPTVTGPVAGFFNNDTQQFATHDPTGFAAAYDSLGDMTGLLANVGREGLSGRFASRYSSAYGMKDDGGDPAIAYQGVWATPFGGKATHEGDDATLDRDITQAGLALGYRWQQQPDLTFGVMAGYINDKAEAESRFAKSLDSEADGFFAGVSGRKSWGNLFLGLGLIGGVMSHDQKRFVNDNLARDTNFISTANASFDSQFISPEAGLSMSFDVGNGFSLTPGARIRYAAQWLDGYTESGSSQANATVDERMLGLFAASAEIAASQKFDFGSITGRVGVLSQTSTGDDGVAVSLIGETKTVGFSASDDLAAYVGVGASIAASDNLSIDLDGQAVFGEDTTGVQGLARIKQRF
jgi:hypothetical protein